MRSQFCIHKDSTLEIGSPVKRPSDWPAGPYFQASADRRREVMEVEVNLSGTPKASSSELVGADFLISAG